MRWSRDKKKQGDIGRVNDNGRMLDGLSTMLKEDINIMRSSSRLPHFHVKPIELVVSARN
jgi:hypothetical protein